MRKYPMLRFGANVDWQHVDPTLLQKLNALGAQTKHVITIFSGYRTDKTSAAVGGFAGDPHTQHIAVDANIGNKPIGSVISPAQFAAVGLVTGNQPNFYKGKRDPAHVQLGGSNPPATVAATPDQAAAPALPTATPVQTDTVPDVFSTKPYEPAPASGMNSASPFAAELWNRIATQPSTSPDTQLLAANAQLLGG